MPEAGSDLGMSPSVVSSSSAGVVPSGTASNCTSSQNVLRPMTCIGKQDLLKHKLNISFGFPEILKRTDYPQVSSSPFTSDWLLVQLLCWKNIALFSLTILKSS